MEGKGVVEETWKEKREKWRLWSIFSQSSFWTTSIFAPAERVFTTYSSCPHVQDSPSLLRWESGKGLLAPHPKPSYSGAVSYRTLNPSRHLACGRGLLEFTISPHVDAQMPENWKVTGPCLFLLLFF